MFTGIVQGTLKIASISQHNGMFALKVTSTEELTNNLKIGASVAINGCCLTVTKITAEEVSFDIIPETISKTTFATMKANNFVNYERSAKFSDEIGGHMISGHIHDTAEVVDISENQETVITLKVAEKWEKYIFHKGYIAVNGCSLTIGEKQGSVFKLHLIPETIKITTFKSIKPKQLVNIEYDSQTIITVDTVYNILNNKYTSSS
jgi:riboflavin synthase